MWEKCNVCVGNEWDLVGCGQMCKGAPVYLYALCITWNE